MSEREPDRGPFVTKTGKVLTDADIEALADEAERERDDMQEFGESKVGQPADDLPPDLSDSLE